MSVRHSILHGNTVVSFVSQPVAMEEILETVESLGELARNDWEWRQVVVLGERTIGGIDRIDLLTLSAWLGDVCQRFSRCWLALCAAGDADFLAARDFAGFVVGTGVQVAVFRNLGQARTWRPLLPRVAAGGTEIQGTYRNRREEGGAA